MKRIAYPDPTARRTVRLASLAAAFAFTAGLLGTLVGAMAPAGQDAAYVAATEVVIQPSTIEVVGARPTATVRKAAAPHVG